MACAEPIGLTPRLQAIAGQVPQGARLADIGTDHAHLPIWLLEQGRIGFAIASDIRTGPLERAAENTARHGLSAQVSLRLGAGLAQVQPGECDVISIAGMGGETIAEILSAAPWTAEGQHLLLLQPMTMIAELRQYLWGHGYEITAETLCREEHRRYVVLTVRGGAQPHKVTLPHCSVSPALLRAEHAEDYLRHLLRRETRALEGLRQANGDVAERLQQQEETVRVIQESLEALK